MSNLEPIEDRDLDLKNKFGSENEKKEGIINERKLETGMPSVEKAAEVRKEGAMEKEKAYSRILAKVKKIQPSQNSQVAPDAESIKAETTAENQVQKLVSLAMEKGVIHAVKVARHLDDNYMLDKFHDRLLVDELYTEFIKKGLIRDV